ncbi:MAG: hypothetical protein RIQ75_1165, partial [Pseudomonadota bacterium]
MRLTEPGKEMLKFYRFEDGVELPDAEWKCDDTGLEALVALLTVHGVAADAQQLRHELGHGEEASA